MRNIQEAMNVFQNLIYYEKLSWSPQFLITVLSRMCVWRYSNEIITISYVVTNSEGIIRSAGDLIVARPLLIEKRCFVSSFTYCLLRNSLYSPWKFQSTFLLRPLPCKRHIPTLLSIVADFATFVAPAFCSLFQPFSFSFSWENFVPRLLLFLYIIIRAATGFFTFFQGFEERTFKWNCIKSLSLFCFFFSSKRWQMSVPPTSSLSAEL